MKYTQKAKEIEAFTFPCDVYVSFDKDSPLLHVPHGDFLLFADGGIRTLTKKEFHAKHDLANEHVGEAKPRRRKVTMRKVNPRRGLKQSVLAQPNGAEREI